MRIAIFLARHKRIGRFVVRGPIRDWLSRKVWDELDTVEFREQMKQSMADYEAGRWYSFDPETGETHPNPDWPKDGPQPEHQ